MRHRPSRKKRQGQRTFAGYGLSGDATLERIRAIVDASSEMTHNTRQMTYLSYVEAGALSKGAPFTGGLGGHTVGKALGDQASHQLLVRTARRNRPSREKVPRAGEVVLLGEVVIGPARHAFDIDAATLELELDFALSPTAALPLVDEILDEAVVVEEAELLSAHDRRIALDIAEPL